MLAESAVCLVEESEQLDVEGGMWTPASAMGGRLIDRLKERAGLAFQVLS
jgi:saccharopine dehydrogenase (NAD+, L-glutamate forming)